MSPMMFVTLTLITVVALAGMSQIQLVTDVMTATGYSAAEILSGIGSILMLFYTVTFVLTWRR